MNDLRRLFFLSLVVKILVGVFLPLSPDEAYYWVWSHHFQLSYFDHPPLTAWLFALGHPFESFFSAVRIPAILFGHLTMGIWMLAFKPHLSKNTLLTFMGLYLLFPLTGPGSIIVTPDLPLLFFWSLSFYIFSMWLEKPSLSLAAALGLALGLGFLAKYTVVLFFIMALVLVIVKKIPVKTWLTQIPVLLLCFLFAALPVWVWNWQNDFISFVFQLNHGLGEQIFKPEWPVSYVLGQVLLLTPFGVWALWSSRKKFPAVFWIFGLGPLIFFLLTSFKGRVEANWPLVAFPPLLLLWSFHSNSLLRRWALALWGLLFVLTLSDVYLKWVPGDDEYIKTRELSAYQDLLPLVEKYQPLYTRTYQMAAKLSFDSRHMIYKLKGLSRKDFYDFRPEALPSTSPYYVIVNKNEVLPIYLQHENWQITKRETVSPQFELITAEKK